MDGSAADLLEFPLTGEEVPLASDIELLIQATLNEKNAPEILEFKTELLQRVEDQLKKQEEYTEQLEQDVEQETRRMVLSLENKRVRYLVKLYYRTRLRKIERFAACILDDENYSNRLSGHEVEYCQQYFVLVGKHLKEVVLDQLPEDLQPLVKTSKLVPGNDLIPYPPMDTHVFCKLLTDVGAVQLDEEQMVDMKSDQLFIIRYRPVAHLVANHQAVLI
ncbi:GINS complex, Sld5 component [Haematococcus lacustris]|uniref:DNA replication complex GINS protein SLD5 n=2 Tax=Haematococcus lacustris TaxID=44745 RepID=A0A699YDK5_HAELA|nr:DNA replication complex GINS protein SLD5 [Haematococcus lacustris]